jgi:hypothetical protein
VGARRLRGCRRARYPASAGRTARRQPPSAAQADFALLSDGPRHCRRTTDSSRLVDRMGNGSGGADVTRRRLRDRFHLVIPLRWWVCQPEPLAPARLPLAPNASGVYLLTRSTPLPREWDVGECDGWRSTPVDKKGNSRMRQPLSRPNFLNPGSCPVLPSFPRNWP